MGYRSFKYIKQNQAPVANALLSRLLLIFRIISRIDNFEDSKKFRPIERKELILG